MFTQARLCGGAEGYAAVLAGAVSRTACSSTEGLRRAGPNRALSSNLPRCCCPT